MASFLQYKTNGIQWAVWKMEESLDALLLLLPGARRAFCEQELNRFVSERRKMEWLPGVIELTQVKDKFCAYLLFPFDFTMMQPVAETRRRQLL